MSSYSRSGEKRTWRRSRKGLIKSDLRWLYNQGLLTQGEYQGALDKLERIESEISGRLERKDVAQIQRIVRQ